MANFAVILIRGPRWEDALSIRDQAGWTEHAAFMDGLVADGFILVGGPIGDGQQTLHVVEAHNEDEVRRRLGEDPWASAGLLEVGSIQPWALWLDFREYNPAHPAVNRGKSRCGSNCIGSSSGGSPYGIYRGDDVVVVG